MLSIENKKQRKRFPQKTGTGFPKKFASGKPHWGVAMIGKEKKNDGVE